MPIKKENRGRYPSDWKELRENVLERANRRCELCGAPDRRWIFRCGGGPVWMYQPGDGPDGIWKGPIKVILTIAHLDPTYRCHDPKCLLALCQRCHLRIDAHFRRHKGVKHQADRGDRADQGNNVK